MQIDHCYKNKRLVVKKLKGTIVYYSILNQGNNMVKRFSFEKNEKNINIKYL